MARRFRRGRRRSFGRARSFVRRTVSQMGPIEAKRVLLEQVTIPNISAVNYDNPLNVDLITTKDTVDEELTSDGTNIAECRNYSKVVGMKLQLRIFNMTANQHFRWMLYKMPDGESLISTLADANFHTSTDSPTQREMRSHILAKGIVVGSDRTASQIPIFIKRKTLRRLGAMRENDKFRLVIASTGSGAKLTGFGTLYVRMN